MCTVKTLDEVLVYGCSEMEDDYWLETELDDLAWAEHCLCVDFGVNSSVLDEFLLDQIVAEDVAEYDLQNELISCCSYSDFHELSGRELDEILACAALGCPDKILRPLIDRDPSYRLL